MNRDSKLKFTGLFALFMLMASGLVAQAHASPLVNACAKAPYGDTWKHYLQFSVDGAVVSKGNLKLAFLISALGKAELKSACLAKFEHTGADDYLRMGLTPAALRAHDVTQIAAYAQAWAAYEAAHKHSKTLSLIGVPVRL